MIPYDFIHMWHIEKPTKQINKINKYLDCETNQQILEVGWVERMDKLGKKETMREDRMNFGMK